MDIEDLEYQVGQRYCEQEDWTNAISCFLNPAEKGMPQAMNDLGVCYERIGEFDKALLWYSVASSGKYDCSTTNLGMLFILGQGVVKNIKYGLSLLREAASHGYIRAYETLGRLYQYGTEVKRNYKKAYQYYLKGARLERQKNDGGLCLANLGYMNMYGLGKEQNLRLGAKYYKEGTERNEPLAIYNLAQCYFNGEGVNKNIEKAAYWWQKAAEQGNEEAQHNLELLHRNIGSSNTNMSDDDVLGSLEDSIGVNNWTY